MKTQHSQEQIIFLIFFKKEAVLIHATTWKNLKGIMITSVQSLSRVQFFASPWTAARQASLSITNSQSLLKFMSIKYYDKWQGVGGEKQSMLHDSIYM